MVYSQIWLNLPKDKSHFFCSFEWIITTYATFKKLLGKTLLVDIPQKMRSNETTSFHSPSLTYRFNKCRSRPPLVVDVRMSKHVFPFVQ